MTTIPQAQIRIPRSSGLLTRRSIKGSRWTASNDCIVTREVQVIGHEIGVVQFAWAKVWVVLREGEWVFAGIKDKPLRGGLPIEIDN